MKTEEPIYIDFTPVNLWRLGISSSPRLHHPRVPPRPSGAPIDIRTYDKNGDTWVKASTGGISTFDGRNPRLSGTHWWLIPQNTVLPAGLKITKNHRDRITGLTHYRIEPIIDMPLIQFIDLLKDLAQSAKKDFTMNIQEEKKESDVL